ncbi:hypothetical protein GCM10023198_42400 [Promicromonospora umidemergens]|uniref:Uncharacterized protein n=1 Tax=Promicromonospora umidemergens TaxID=629679 RepID=A0ABP8XU22_9MICO
MILHLCNTLMRMYVNAAIGTRAAEPHVREAEHLLHVICRSALGGFPAVDVDTQLDSRVGNAHVENRTDVHARE